jgi:protein required for attachment to host cells
MAKLALIANGTKAFLYELNGKAEEVTLLKELLAGGGRHIHKHMVDAYKTNSKINDEKDQAQLITDFEDPVAREHDRDLTTDKAGRAFEGFNPTKHAYEIDSPHIREREHFAKELAEIVNFTATDKRYNNIILAASPEFLGELRPYLNKKAHEKISIEINKDLTHVPHKDLVNTLKHENVVV